LVGASVLLDASLQALERELLEAALRHVGAQLFNSMLLRPDLCSAANARYIIEGLNKLDAWLLEVDSAATAAAYTALAHVRQVCCCRSKPLHAAQNVAAHAVTCVSPTLPRAY
jgi:hypothetical protein